MIVSIERYAFGADSTLGRLYLDGVPRCFTLEDQTRLGAKVPGETAIPEGRYPLVLRTVGGFHARYGKAVPDIHRGMLWLQDVPGFRWILIHMGNTDDDTAGCILLGARPVIGLDGELAVHQSRIAYRDVYPEIAAAILRGETVALEVTVARHLRGLVA